MVAPASVCMSGILLERKAAEGEGEGEWRRKGLTPLLLLHTEDAESSQNTHTFNKRVKHTSQCKPALIS